MESVAIKTEPVWQPEGEVADSRKPKAMQPLKIEEETVLMPNLEKEANSDEEMFQVDVKDEVTIEEHPISPGHYSEDESLMEEMMSELTSLFHSCDSAPLKTVEEQEMACTSDTCGIEPGHTTEQENLAITSADGVHLPEDATSVVESTMRIYFAAQQKSQAVLSRLAASLDDGDKDVLTEVTNSARELASATKLLADTIKELAAAEKNNSKAAIINARIELAKAKREGIEIL